MGRQAGQAGGAEGGKGRFGRRNAVTGTAATPLSEEIAALRRKLEQLETVVDAEPAR